MAQTLPATISGAGRKGRGGRKKDLDIVWWDDQQKSLVFAELTISYETNFEAAAERKEVNYEELVTGAGYDTELITLEVGSRGVINPTGFQSLKAALNSTTTCREMSELMFELCK